MATSLNPNGARSPAYTIDEHRHRFAVWAAGRAAQRGLSGGSNAVLAKAVEICGVREAVQAHSAWSSDSAEFDRVHATWCNAILAHLKKSEVAGASFGRAAKLIAIYLKTMVLISGSEDTKLGQVIHPPIDGILLRAMAADLAFDKASRRHWRKTVWTKLDQGEYSKLIESLRRASCAQPFWMLERYWDGGAE
jgi:hypothetical protein